MFYHVCPIFDFNGEALSGALFFRGNQGCCDALALIMLLYLRFSAAYLSPPFPPYSANIYPGAIVVTRQNDVRRMPCHHHGDFSLQRMILPQMPYKPIGLCSFFFALRFSGESCTGVSARVSTDCPNKPQQPRPGSAMP